MPAGVAHVADPLGLTPGSDQVLGAVDREEVHRGVVQLAGAPAPVLEDPGAPDADAHAGQAAHHPVEDVAGEPVGPLVVGRCRGRGWCSWRSPRVGVVMNIDPKREQCSCQVLVFSPSSNQTGRMSPARTARERVREEMTAEILAVARAHVAREGAAALSLRSIARDLEMAPSALYRYFDGRDALLSALILDAYEALAAEAERAADAARGRARGRRRTLAVRAPGLARAGPWRTRTSGGSSSAPRCPATRRPRTRSSPTPGWRRRWCAPSPTHGRPAGSGWTNARGEVSAELRARGGAGDRRALPRHARRQGRVRRWRPGRPSSASSASRCSGTGATPSSTRASSSRPPCGMWRTPSACSEAPSGVARAPRPSAQAVAQGLRPCPAAPRGDPRVPTRPWSRRARRRTTPARPAPCWAPPA